MHDNQLFSVRSHFDYGSPSRNGNGTVNNGQTSVLVESGDGHHKSEHYTQIDDKYDPSCGAGNDG